LKEQAQLGEEKLRLGGKEEGGKGKARGKIREAIRENSGVVWEWPDGVFSGGATDKS